MCIVRRWRGCGSRFSSPRVLLYYLFTIYKQLQSRIPRRCQLPRLGAKILPRRATETGPGSLRAVHVSCLLPAHGPAHRHTRSARAPVQGLPDAGCLRLLRRLFCTGSALAPPGLAPHATSDSASGPGPALVVVVLQGWPDSVHAPQIHPDRLGDGE